MKKYFFFDIDGTLTTPLTADQRSHPTPPKGRALRLACDRTHSGRCLAGRV